ncbi:45952_t:CDS:1, partial [Gigaspora margarita]
CLKMIKQIPKLLPITLFYLLASTFIVDSYRHESSSPTTTETTTLTETLTACPTDTPTPTTFCPPDNNSNSGPTDNSSGSLMMTEKIIIRKTIRKMMTII